MKAKDKAPIFVTLTPEQMEECRDIAERMENHYRNNGDRRSAMPWTRDQFTDDELRQWLASRKEAGRKIDIETCEIGWWWANCGDDYGILDRLGDPDPEPCIGRVQFVRSPESDGWVSLYDLTEESRSAVWRRIDRESRQSLTSASRRYQFLAEQIWR